MLPNYFEFSLPTRVRYIPAMSFRLIFVTTQVPHLTERPYDKRIR